MGGVCPGGNKTRKSDFRDKEIGVSGKIGRRGSKPRVVEKAAVVVEEEVKKVVIESYPSYESKRFQSRFDSGELNFSISRELKPSMTARTGTGKVHCFCLTFCVYVFACYVWFYMTSSICGEELELKKTCSMLRFYIFLQWGLVSD